MSGTPGRWEREIFLTVLGSGYAPFASGSWGSLAAIVLYAGAWLGAAAAGIGPQLFDLLINLPAVLLAGVLSVRWGAWAIERWGRKDPKPFVLDEFAGQWVALLALPPAIGAGWWGFACLLGGQFFLFRLMDVLKPPPANIIDRRWPAGWGIFCDDVVAGVYANVLGQLAWRTTPLAAWLGVATSGT
ncbi:MAG: phosphatidylglycerophosphatase A [Planctomycetota bacterium]